MNKELNIPIYRAKKLDSDEYAEGFLFNPFTDVCFMFKKGSGGLEEDQSMNIIEEEYSEVEQATLAIHFPDMIDSEGTKIFASLSEDGKGGDMFTLAHHTLTAVFRDSLRGVTLRHDNGNPLLFIFEEFKKAKVAGIQE